MHSKGKDFAAIRQPFRTTGDCYGRKSITAALMEAVKTHSLGQISHALYDVGGEYRRNM